MPHAPVLEPLRKSPEVQRIQGVIRVDAALARHRQPPPHEVELRDGMGVGIDAEDAAELQGAPMPAPVKIEPPRICVDLDGDAVIRARLQDFLDVHVIAWPAQEQAAGHVPENGDERIGGSAQETLRLLRAIHPELSMDAGDDEIESPQNLVGIVERPIGENVGLDALEDAKTAVEARIEPIDFGVLLVDLFYT